MRKCKHEITEQGIINHVFDGKQKMHNLYVLHKWNKHVASLKQLIFIKGFPWLKAVLHRTKQIILTALLSFLQITCSCAKISGWQDACF